MPLAEGLLRKSFDSPDQTRSYAKLRTDLVNLGKTVVSRNVYQPGWRWSESIWPLVRLDGCPIRHLFFMVSGRMKVRMKGGVELEFGPGDVGEVPPGHDAWVVGEDPVELIDFGGNMSSYPEGRDPHVGRLQ